MIKFPIGIQSFDQIIKDQYVYVDKTALLYQLVTMGKIYFLSRPRRFGKSLLISTLKSYFLGRKELFKGLRMEGLEKEWLTYPLVVRLNGYWKIPCVCGKNNMGEVRNMRILADVLPTS